MPSQPIAELDSAGNLLLGVSSIGVGGKFVAALGNGNAPAAIAGVQMWSGAGNLKVMDSGGDILTFAVTGNRTLTISGDVDLSAVPTPTNSATADTVLAGTGAGTSAWTGTPTLTTLTATGVVKSKPTSTAGIQLDPNAATGNFTLSLSPANLTAARRVTFPDVDGTVVFTSNKLSVFAATTSAELAGVISDETGSGALVFASSPTLVTPALGAATATSLALTTDLAVADGGTGVSTLADAGVLVGNGAGAVQVTGAGTAGQVLTSNGAGVDPTFQAATGGVPANLIAKHKSGMKLTWVDASTVNVAVGAIGLNGVLYNVSAANVTFADIDTGAEAAGKDYYVWAVLSSGVVSFKVSLSATTPTGSYTDYRLAGWFHNNGSSAILKYSVATAPGDGNTDAPEYGPKPGMVQFPGQPWMIDIYIASDSGGTGKAIIAAVNAAASAYNATPWVSRTYFQEYKSCLNAGKRLCTNEEWSMAAFGTPPGANNNTNCWTAAANTGSNPTGTLANCVSTLGCYDMTGNVWERVATWYPITDVAADQSGWGWTNQAGTWTNEAEGGEAYTPFGVNAGPDANQGPRALVRGGLWYDSAYAGGWTVAGNNSPRLASGIIGFRCCS